MTYTVLSGTLNSSIPLCIGPACEAGLSTEAWKGACITADSDQWQCVCVYVFDILVFMLEHLWLIFSPGGDNACTRQGLQPHAKSTGQGVQGLRRQICACDHYHDSSGSWRRRNLQTPRTVFQECCSCTTLVFLFRLILPCNITLCCVHTGRTKVRTKVRLSVSDPKSRMEGCSKLKIGGKEAHDTGDPWRHI